MTQNRGQTSLGQFFIWLLLISCLTVMLIDHPQCQAAANGTPIMSRAKSVQDFFNKVQFARKHKSLRTPSSLFNEYLCQVLPDSNDDFRINESELVKLRLVFHEFETKPDIKYYKRHARMYNKLVDQLILYIKLFDHRRKKQLCSIEAQTTFVAIDWDIQANQADLRATGVEFSFHPQEEDKFQCNRLKLISDHYNALRRQECGTRVIESLDQDLVIENKLIAMLANGFMDLVVDKLGGYSLSTCLKPWIVDRLPGSEAAKTLIAGFRTIIGATPETNDKSKSSDRQDLVEARELFFNEKPLKFSKPEEEVEYLNKFIKYRNESLVEPCKILVQTLKDRFDSIKLYKSMFGDHSINSNGSEDTIELVFKTPSDEKRFIRAWSMVNTCRYVILPRLTRLSLAIMEQLGYNLKASKIQSRWTDELQYKGA